MTGSERACAIVTGGNGGIGYATAEALIARDWQVVITGRNETALADAAARLGGGTAWRVGDFASLEAVRGLAAELVRLPRIDALVNNAGIALTERRVTGDGNEMVMQVNHLAPFLLTTLMLDKLRACAPVRVFNVASRMHMVARTAYLDDIQFERGYSTARSYGRSKLYNILFSRELARRMEGTGVTVNAVHPGGIRSSIGADGDMRGFTGWLYRLMNRRSAPASRAGNMIADLVTAPEHAATTGRYFGSDGQLSQTSALAADDDTAARLWQISERLVGTTAPLENP